jgi:hypothetical protein
MLRVTAALLLLSLPGFSADLSGKWTGRAQLVADHADGLPGRPVDGVVLELVQSGNNVVGSYSEPPDAPVKLQFFRMENDRIVIWYHTARNVLVTGALTLKDGWITGRLTRSSGEVTLIAVRKP